LDGLREKLQGTLPTGIQVTEVESVDERAPALQTQVVSAEYEVSLAEAGFGSEVKRKIESVLESDSIIRTRRGKEYDLRPLVEELRVSESSGLPLMQGQAPALRIFMRLAAREGATGRPEEVLDVLGIAFEDTRIERTRLIFQA